MVSVYSENPKHNISVQAHYVFQFDLLYICYAIIVFSSCANFGLILYINGESVSGQMENIVSERV